MLYFLLNILSSKHYIIIIMFCDTIVLVETENLTFISRTRFENRDKKDLTFVSNFSRFLILVPPATLVAETKIRKQQQPAQGLTT